MIPAAVLFTVALATAGATDSAAAASPPRLYRTALFCPDVSISVDPTEFENCMRALAAGLPAFVARLGVERVEIHPWASAIDAWRSSTMVWAMPRPRPVVYVPPHETEKDWLFRAAKENTERKAREAYEARRASADSAYARELRQATRAPADTLAGLRQGSAPCTAVASFLRYRCTAMDSSTITIVVTDLLDDCGHRIASSPRTSAASTTIVIVVPSKDAPGEPGEVLQARLDWLRATAPWVKVVVPSFLVRPDGEWLDMALRGTAPAGPCPAP